MTRKFFKIPFLQHLGDSVSSWSAASLKGFGTGVEGDGGSSRNRRAVAMGAVRRLCCEPRGGFDLNRTAVPLGTAWRTQWNRVALSLGTAWFHYEARGGST